MIPLTDRGIGWMVVQGPPPPSLSTLLCLSLPRRSTVGAALGFCLLLGGRILLCASSSSRPAPPSRVRGLFPLRAGWKDARTHAGSDVCASACVHGWFAFRCLPARAHARAPPLARQR